ncbi:unnamed protein product, partial [Polarella glacialis]
MTDTYAFASGLLKKAGGIVDMLEDLLDKAEENLDDLRKKETVAINNFSMLSRSLENEIKFGKDSEIEDLQGKIDAAAAKSAQLKKGITAALSELAATNANMAKVRQEEKALFDKIQPEMQSGTEGAGRSA